MNNIAKAAGIARWRDELNDQVDALMQPEYEAMRLRLLDVKLDEHTTANLDVLRQETMSWPRGFHKSEMLGLINFHDREM